MEMKLKSFNNYLSPEGDTLISINILTDGAVSISTNGTKVDIAKLAELIEALEEIVE